MSPEDAMACNSILLKAVFKLWEVLKIKNLQNQQL